MSRSGGSVNTKQVTGFHGVCGADNGHDHFTLRLPLPCPSPVGRRELRWSIFQSPEAPRARPPGAEPSQVVAKTKEVLDRSAQRLGMEAQHRLVKWTQHKSASSSIKTNTASLLRPPPPLPQLQTHLGTRVLLGEGDFAGLAEVHVIPSQEPFRQLSEGEERTLDFEASVRGQRWPMPQHASSNDGWMCR